ncbi:MAG: DUF3089 domain-containing protein [Lachnospiraceae bacterium]|nr:DUF3089 domain-containing protein [Lachnospiraceae bacterium]
MYLKKIKLVVAVSISLLTTSLAPMGAFAAEDEFVDEVVFETADSYEEDSEEVFSCGLEDEEDLLCEESDLVEAFEAGEEAAGVLDLSDEEDAEGKDFVVTDYNVSDNWIAYGDSNKDDTQVDVFWVCSSVSMAGITNVENNDYIKSLFKTEYSKQRGIYADSAKIYAPFYQQIGLQVYKYGGYDSGIKLAYSDVKEAFGYYLEHENKGRPVILAGYSQGADMCYRLMQDYYAGDSEQAKKLNDNLVAVYAIGWALTDDMVKNNPQMKPAEGETDTGVIISYECEDDRQPTMSENFVIPNGVKAIAINPLNWKSDSTKASKELNIYSCNFYKKGDKKAYWEGTKYCGAYIDDERGCLKVTDLAQEDDLIFLPALGSASLHLYDYSFFYGNLKKNVADRVAAFMNGKSEETISDGNVPENSVSDDDTSENSPSKNEALKSSVDPVNGNPILCDADAKAMAETYLKLAVASNDKSGQSMVETKGSMEDTGSILQYYSKGKIKKLEVSDNGLKACDVTVNAKVKLVLKGQYEVSGNSLAAEGKFNLPANAKMPKAKFKDGETTVSLKAIKGAYKYRVSFVDKSTGKTVTVHVENLAFHKTIKKTGVYSRAVSGNDISGNKAVGRDTFVIRPTLLNIENGAGMLNGVWMVDKEIINRVGKENAVKSKKNGSTCYIDEKSGCLIVTAPTQKGNAKIIYNLNGKKYSTAVKAGGTDPKASLLPNREVYAKYNLLYVTPENSGK